MNSFTLTVVGVMLVALVTVEAHIDPAMVQDFKDKAKEIMTSCSEKISAGNFAKMIIDRDVQGMDIEGKCFAACALSNVGLMKEGKLQTEQIEQAIKSVIDGTKACVTEANLSLNECEVIGKFGECMKKLDI